MVKKKSTKKTAKKAVKKSSKKSAKKMAKKPVKKKAKSPAKADSHVSEKTNIQIRDVDVQKDTKNLLWIIAGIILVFIVFFLIRFIIPEAGDDGVKTIDELHQLNLRGELEDNNSYVYEGFSFVKVDDLWYTQLQKGNTIFDVTFNYGPEELEDLPVEGSLTKEFIESKKFYITFDPEGEYLRHIAVANYGLSNSLVRAFGFDLEAGCLTNTTEDCATAEIITCDDVDKNIFYFKEDAEAKVIFDNNCVVLQGEGSDLVRAKDRLLLRWYNIMR